MNAAELLSRNRFVLDGMSLANLDFTGLELANVSFLGAQLFNCRFGDAENPARIDRCRFQGATLEACDFRYVEISRTSFARATLVWCDFYRSSLGPSVIFEQSRVTFTSFNRADLSGTTLRRCNLSSGAGAGILQEDASAFADFHARWGHLSADEIVDRRRTRLVEVVDVFQALEGAWSGQGAYADDSWACQRRKWAEFWWNVQTLSERRGDGDREVQKQLAAASRALWLGVAGITTGFGERLGRSILTLLVLVQATGATLYLLGAVRDPGGAKSSLADHFVYAWGNLVSNAPERLSITGSLGETIVIAQSVFSVVFAGLVGFVLANRIRYS